MTFFKDELKVDFEDNSQEEITNEVKCDKNTLKGIILAGVMFVIIFIATILLKMEAYLSFFSIFILAIDIFAIVSTQKFKVIFDSRAFTHKSLLMKEKQYSYSDIKSYRGNLNNIEIIMNDGRHIAISRKYNGSERFIEMIKHIKSFHRQGGN